MILNCTVGTGVGTFVVVEEFFMLDLSSIVEPEGEFVIAQDIMTSYEQL